MYEQVEKPKENKSRAVANSVTQQKSNGKQGLGFVDNRPKVCFNSPSVPVQRTVSKVWGKWRSSYDMTRDFTSEEEAKTFDNAELIKAQEAKKAADEAAEKLAEETWSKAAEAAAWKFSDAGGRLAAHFKDGWGAVYGICSYEQIKQRVIVEGGSEEVGKHEIYLGNHKNKEQVKGCNILYENKVVPITAGGITRDSIQTDVFHCGPGTGAG